jgi:membrane protein YqaA with SNARE-associated domain
MEEAPDTATAQATLDRKAKLRNALYRFGGIVLAMSITVGIFMFRDRLQAVGKYGYLGIFLISLIGNATIVLPAPTFVAAFAGGGVLNPLAVAIVSAAGATLGEMTGYLAGTSGHAVIQNRAMYERFEQWMKRYGLAALFVLAAIPNPFFDVAGIIAGITKMRVTTFLLVTWAGKIVKFLIIAYLGAGSSNLLDNLFG